MLQTILGEMFLRPSSLVPRPSIVILRLPTIHFVREQIQQMPNRTVSITRSKKVVVHPKHTFVCFFKSRNTRQIRFGIFFKTQIFNKGIFLCRKHIELPVATGCKFLLHLECFRRNHHKRSAVGKR